MKVWASVSAIGFSMAYLAACSSAPPDGTPVTIGGGGASAGAAPMAGAPATTAGTGGTVMAGGGTAGTAGTDMPAGGAAPMAGAGGAAGGGAGAAGGTGAGEGACPTGVVGHCDAGVTIDSYPKYPGYTLNTVEDFPVALDLDKDPIFTWSDGSPANGQTGFRKEQITFANGKMLLTATSTCPASTANSNCYPQRTSYGEALTGMTMANVGKMGVWSGELRTKYNNYRYGRYEVKFHAPSANPGHETDSTMAGDFLSTMFVFRNPKNAIWNEIDIELEPSLPAEIAGNAINIAGRGAYPNDSNEAWHTAGPAGYKNIDEHVYAFTWTPTAIDWYLDGVAIKHFGGGQATAGSFPIPTSSAKIMMNLWIFDGNNFGAGSNNKFPFDSEYDYFHFYKLDTETTYPCSPAPACLPAGDKTTSAQNNPMEMNYGM